MKARLAVLCFSVVLFAALVLAACSPNPSNSGSDSADGGASSESWTMESECGSCHVKESESAQDPSTPHGIHSALACNSCHIDEDGKLGKAHEDYKDDPLPEALKITKVSSDACTGCHDTVELAAKTASTGVLTDENGLTVNPHDIPETENHESSVFCSSCHKMHSESSVVDTAQSVCLNCHHENVYECGTCH